MAKFERKPLTIDAEQWFPGQEVPGVQTCRPCDLSPDDPRDDPANPPWHYVTTIHGQRVYLEPGDWVIAEPDGEHFYPCRPDVFAERYQPKGNEQDAVARLTRERDAVTALMVRRSQPGEDQYGPYFVEPPRGDTTYHATFEDAAAAVRRLAGLDQS